MKRILLLLLISTFFKLQISAQSPTWADDIACIVYNKCTACHNPDGVGPFSLMSYNDAFIFRGSIKNATGEKSMPPWNAKSGLVEYVDDLSLTDQEIALIAEWVDSGAAQGDPASAPNAPVFEGTEEITNPDVVIQFPEYTSQAVEEDDYRCFVEPWPATQYQWVVGTEVVPGNTSIVHHNLFAWDPTNTAINLDAADPGPGYYCFGNNGSSSSNQIGGWVPGASASILPDGFGFQLPPGGNIIIQTHFPEGSVGQSDDTKINFQFSDQTNLRRIKGGAVLNHNNSLTNGPLFIPANTEKTFYAEATALEDMTVLSMTPHMHLIGVAIKAFAVTPTGDTLHLIDIPKWDFDWQYTYELKSPVIIPQGSIIYGEGSYDNTNNNSLNPSTPPVDVSLGEATTDEMFLVFFTWSTYQPGDESLYFEDSPDLVDCGVVSTIEPSIEKLVRVSPNPATNDVRLSYDGTFSGQVEIFDSSGKLVRKAENIELPANISLHGLVDGVYFLKFRNEKMSFAKRVVVSQ